MRISLQRNIGVAVLTLAIGGPFVFGAETGRMLFKQGNFAKALPLLFKDLGPKTIDDGWLIGQGLRALNLPEGADLFERRVMQGKFAQAPKSSSAIYGRGVELFQGLKFDQAGQWFAKVPKPGAYYARATFYRGVLAHLGTRNSEAIALFQEVKKQASALAEHDKRNLTELANLNLARIKYQERQFVASVGFYSNIPKDSDHWLTALFESSWAFLLLEKANNALGNIHTLHSAYFNQRFYPESFIVESITYLRLCRYDRVHDAIKRFNERYGGVDAALIGLLKSHETDRNAILNLTRDYQQGSKKVPLPLKEVVDALARSDVYKHYLESNRRVSEEQRSLPSEWSETSLAQQLAALYKESGPSSEAEAGVNLYSLTKRLARQLRDLTDQTKMITAELLLGQVDALKQKMNLKTAPKPQNFIGGLQPLKLKQDLEYWPFEGEYWKDELGGYVYNIESSCKS